MIYKALVKYEGTFKIIELETKSKSEFITILRDNGFKVSNYKVKEKSLFDRVMELMDYVDSKEDGEIVWKHIKYVDDTIETIMNRYFKF